ncbi:MAG: hypothetical protein JW778_07430 [Candidatus Altiarchaeota archaeon]|nr:hypothetical protein [Candidatus Altiarchaeota archaeon]
MAVDGYALSEKQQKGTEPTPKEAATIKEVRDQLVDDIKDTKKIEIIASLTFLKKENTYQDDRQLISRLGEMKPWLTEKEITENLKKAKKICTAFFDS